ncbi:MAG: NTP transferase domain-containing protein [Planctomycetaceae bacterium]|jgi:GTP:adenosylcobinamide-phosphate guanylyltransferase/aminoglycoside phosphotransferase|nr:NTP transferase domain-containing protein [Planctomycetaceae bacterium]
MQIIIQAGGKGTRLEGLTRNKPKCLVPVNNLPILFYILRQFKEADFTIIADYKADVLSKYLACFGKDYRYKIVTPRGQGTIAGIKEALQPLAENEPFMLIWSDLMLAENFTIPDVPGNYIGIAGDFECRWAYRAGQFIREASKTDGVAGLFIFATKNHLQDIPEEGAFVRWLQTQSIPFERLELTGTKEIGTLISYTDNNDTPCCRPFNAISIDGGIVVKRPVSEQGRKIAADEIAWYKTVRELGYEFIPEILAYEPLTMRRVQGKNIWEYDCLTRSQKKQMLAKIIGALKELHNLVPPKPVSEDDVKANYFDKTFERLEKVRKLIPFAEKEFIRINGRYYKNVFFDKETFGKVWKLLIPKEFKLIHGDCTFSNMMFDTFNMKTVLIDPRGYFGNTKLYGDADYDWAKLYYSIKGSYDQFNRKKFTLDIRANDVELAIKTNDWADMEEFFFDFIPGTGRNKIRILHTVIWLSLTTYCWEDYDSICGAFYNGVVQSEILEN